MSHHRPPALPLCCAPSAYELLKQSIGSGSDVLVSGMVAISKHQYPGVRAEAVDAAIQGVVDKVRSRVRGCQPQAMLAHLHDVMFEEMGFRGNVLDFYNPHNSYLPAVLDTRMGMPITLCAIYVIVATRLGLKSWGIGLPGHFLAGVECGGTRMMVDPFAGGRILTADEACARMREIFGENAEWSDEMLRPVSNRHWLTRAMQNLLNIFGSQGDYASAAAMLEMELALWPEQLKLQRDIGLIYVRLGMSDPARQWLGYYLSQDPDDPQAGDLSQLLEVLSS